MTAKLTFRPGMPPLSWGHPDSPRRPLCAVCHGALPEQAIVMFTEQGFCAAFCDPCVERWIEIEIRAPRLLRARTCSLKAGNHPTEMAQEARRPWPIP